MSDARVYLGEGPTVKGVKWVGYREGEKLIALLVEAYGSCWELDRIEVKDMAEMMDYIDRDAE